MLLLGSLQNSIWHIEQKKHTNWHQIQRQKTTSFDLTSSDRNVRLCTISMLAARRFSAIPLMHCLIVNSRFVLNTRRRRRRWLKFFICHIALLLSCCSCAYFISYARLFRFVLLLLFFVSCVCYERALARISHLFSYFVFGILFRGKNLYKQPAVSLDSINCKEIK